MAIIFKNTGLSDAITSLGDTISSTITDITEKRKKASKEKAFQTRLKGAIDEGGDELEFIKRETLSGTIPEKFQKGIETIYGPQIKSRAETEELKKRFPELYSNDENEPLPNEDPTPDSPEKFNVIGDPNEIKQASSLYNADEKTLNKLLLDKKTAPLAKNLIDQRNKNAKSWEADRKYSTGETKDYKKHIQNLNTKIKSTEYWLPLAIDSIQSGNTSWFSGDNLANLTGIEAFRTLEGAQLMTASKQYLVGNLTGIKGRPNQFIEQTILSAFPMIGRSQEANMAVAVALQGEMELMKAENEIYNRLAAEDISSTSRDGRQGFVKQDIQKRVDEELEGRFKNIKDKTAYQIKQIKEKGKDLTKLTNEKVIKGTPLTPKMGAAFVKKYGSRENAEKVAKKMGYTILDVEKIKEWENL